VRRGRSTETIHSPGRTLRFVAAEPGLTAWCVFQNATAPVSRNPFAAEDGEAGLPGLHASLTPTADVGAVRVPARINNAVCASTSGRDHLRSGNDGLVKGRGCGGFESFDFAVHALRNRSGREEETQLSC
jgi:hypothetical protein